MCTGETVRDSLGDEDARHSLSRLGRGALVFGWIVFSVLEAAAMVIHQRLAARFCEHQALVEAVALGDCRPVRTYSTCSRL